MPFGDNVKMRQATISRDEFGPGMETIPSRRVNVPTADPPWWWSDYLTEEWKRKNRVDQVRRDNRSQWQRDYDEWQWQLCRWDVEDYGRIGNKPGLTKPHHAIWDEPTGESGSNR